MTPAPITPAALAKWEGCARNPIHDAISKGHGLADSHLAVPRDVVLALIAAARLAHAQAEEIERLQIQSDLGDATAALLDKAEAKHAAQAERIRLLERVANLARDMEFIFRGHPITESMQTPRLLVDALTALDAGKEAGK